MPAVELLVDTLATYRLTKLVVDDVITETPRDAVIVLAYAAQGRQVPDDGCETLAEAVHADADPPKVAVLLTCPWCAGMWVALGVVVARRLAPRLWSPLARALGMSAAAGLLSTLDG